MDPLPTARGGPQTHSVIISTRRNSLLESSIPEADVSDRAKTHMRSGEIPSWSRLPTMEAERQTTVPQSLV